jgi:hypothetical protein
MSGRNLVPPPFQLNVSPFGGICNPHVTRKRVVYPADGGSRFLRNVANYLTTRRLRFLEGRNFKLAAV